MRTLKPWALAAGLLLTASLAGALTYGLRDSDTVTTAQQPPTTPDGQATPVSGSTPDTSQPGWHIPYLNADREKPKFKGTLNGIDIDADWPGRTALDVCPAVGLNPVDPSVLLATVVAPGPLRIDPRLLPKGVTTSDPPDAFACRGALADVVWKFHAEPGIPGVNPGGSPVLVRRIMGKEPLQHSAPRDRWATATVRGVDAVVLRPIIEADGKEFGECVVALYNAKTDAFTTVIAAAANAQFCLDVAEAVTS